MVQINIVDNTRTVGADDLDIRFIAVLPQSSDGAEISAEVIPVVAYKTAGCAFGTESVNRAAYTGVHDLLACLPELSQHCGLSSSQCGKLAITVKQVASMVIANLTSKREPLSTIDVHTSQGFAPTCSHGKQTSLTASRANGTDRAGWVQAEDGDSCGERHDIAEPRPLREACSGSEPCTTSSLSEGINGQESTLPTTFSKKAPNLGTDMVPFSRNLEKTFVPLKLELSGRTVKVKSSMRLQPMQQKMGAVSERDKGVCESTAANRSPRMFAKPGSAPALQPRSKRYFCIDGKWCGLQRSAMPCWSCVLVGTPNSIDSHVFLSLCHLLLFFIHYDTPDHIKLV
jgi:hypothetical protein